MAGEKLPSDVLSEVNAHIASLRPQIQQVAIEVLDGVDAAAVADRALEAMDENLDGKVTRDEFLSLFLSVMTEVTPGPVWRCWLPHTTVQGLTKPCVVCGRCSTHS